MNTLSVAKHTSLSSTLSVLGATNLENTLSVASHTSLSSTLSVKKATNLENTLSVAAHTSLSSTLSVAGATNLENTLSVAAHTSLSSTLSVTGATNIENTLYLKQNGWIRESIVNNKTDRYVDPSDGNDNEGIQVRNIEANRKTYLSSRSVSGVSINGIYNVFTLQYKNSSNDWINLDRTGEGTVEGADEGAGEGDYTFLDGGQGETVVFLAQSNLSAGNRIYHNEKDDITSYGLKIDTSSSSVLTTNPDDWAQAQNVYIDSNEVKIGDANNNIDNIVYIANDVFDYSDNILADQNEIFYIDSSMDFKVKLNDKYLYVDENAGKLKLDSSNNTNFRFLEPHFNTQMHDSQSNLDNVALTAVNRYTLQTSDRNVDINADLKVYDRYNETNYLTISSLRDESSNASDDNIEKNNSSHHININREAIIADTLDFKTYRDNVAGIQKIYNMKVDSADEVVLNIYGENGGNFNPCEINTDHAVSIQNSVTNSANELLNKIILKSVNQYSVDQQKVLCFGDKVELFTDAGDQINATEPGSGTYSGEKMILAEATPSGATEFTLYPNNESLLGKPIQVLEQFTTESLSEEVTLRITISNIEYKVYAVSELLKYIEIPDASTAQIFKFGFKNLESKARNKAVRFQKDSEGLSTGTELAKSTFVGVNPNSIDHENITGLYKNSLIIGNGSGNNSIRLGESLNVDSLLIFNNNPQSNVRLSNIDIDNVNDTVYSVNASQYSINSTSLTIGTYDQMNSENEVGQIKMRVSDIPNPINNDIYSGGLYEIDVKNKSKWNKSAMKLTERADLYIKGGLHQYDSYQFVEIGYNLAKRTTVNGKLFAHAYVSDNVLYEYSIEGVGDKSYYDSNLGVLYQLGSESSGDINYQDISSNTDAFTTSNFTNGTNTNLSAGTKKILFGKRDTSELGGVLHEIGDILIDASVIKYSDNVSIPEFKDNIFIIKDTIRFIDRGIGLTTNTPIVLHNSYKNSTLPYPFYDTNNLATSNQMAFKITPLSLVSGGINTIRTESFAAPSTTDSWINPTYGTPDYAPIYSVNNGMVYVTSNDKLDVINNVSNLIVPNPDISASFETLTNNQNVFNYVTGDYDIYPTNILADNTGYFSGARGSGITGLASAYVINPGSDYLKNIDGNYLGTISDYSDKIYDKNNVMGISNDILNVDTALDSHFTDVDNAFSDVQGTILLTNNSFDTVASTGLTTAPLTQDANRTDGILGGNGVYNVDSSIPYIKNTVASSTAIQLKSFSGDTDENTNTVLRVVWDGKPIIIKNDLNVFYQDILIDLIGNPYTRDAIKNNIKDYFYIPVTVIHSKISDLPASNPNYLGGDAVNAKCKFVVAYDVNGIYGDTLNNFYKSINPDNINKDAGDGVSVIDKFWENIDNLNILSMNNKSNYQIIDFNTPNKTITDEFVIKVNVGYPVKMMEVIRISQTRSDNHTGDNNNLLSDSRFKF